MALAAWVLAGCTQAYDVTIANPCDADVVVRVRAASGPDDVMPDELGTVPARRAHKFEGGLIHNSEKRWILSIDGASGSLTFAKREMAAGTVVIPAKSCRS